MGKRRWSPTTCMLAVLTGLVLTSYTALFFYHTALITAGQNKYILQLSDIASRSNRMHRQCQALPRQRQLTLPLNGRLFYISDKYNLSYCRAAGVGSTLWAQIFMELSGIWPELVKNGGLESVFDIPRNETHAFMRKHPETTVKLSNNRLRDTTNFLVARNPYSRLFSTYIDQIFLPNKWKQAVHMGRDTKHGKCGSNVTFEEFLSAISIGILSEKETDLHWAPIFSICLPCETKIDILAKYETYLQDAEDILTYVGVKKSLIDNVKRASTLHNTDTMHSIQTLLHTYLIKSRQVPRGCISESQLAQKLWTAFQILGILHNEHEFPSDLFKTVNEDNTETILLNELMKATKKKKMTMLERDIQRKSWQKWFWKSVSIETVKLVQNAFYEDFIVFDYDMDLSIL